MSAIMFMTHVRNNVLTASEYIKIHIFELRKMI